MTRSVLTTALLGLLALTTAAEAATVRGEFLEGSVRDGEVPTGPRLRFTAPDLLVGEVDVERCSLPVFLPGQDCPDTRLHTVRFRYPGARLEGETVRIETWDGQVLTIGHLDPAGGDRLLPAEGLNIELAEGRMDLQQVADGNEAVLGELVAPMIPAWYRIHGVDTFGFDGEFLSMEVSGSGCTVNIPGNLCHAIGYAREEYRIPATLRRGELLVTSPAGWAIPVATALPGDPEPSVTLHEGVRVHFHGRTPGLEFSAIPPPLH